MNNSVRQRAIRMYTAQRAAVAIGSLLLVGTAGMLGANSAWAGNGLHPRTPVLFPPTECLTIVDRSVDPILHIEYEIPYEDPGDDMMVWEDEVDQSRTHQFFALCRDHSRQEYLPEWTVWADVNEADGNGLLTELPTDDGVFETSAEWSGCWYRVNEDADRRPISFAAAAEGVDWDTSAVPAGTYALRGYTFEPAFNFFWRRPGVVKVVDDPADENAPPALAIMNGTDMGQMGMGEEGGITVYRNELLPLEGCVASMPGSALTGYYALTEGGELGVWTPFSSDVPLADVSDGASWTLDFEPPPETHGTSIAIRVDVTDPMQRTYSGHAFWLVSVINADAPVECDEMDSTGFIGPQCETSSGGETGTSTGDSAGSDTDTSAGTSAGTSATGVDGTDATGGPDEETDGDGGGCGCRAESGDSSELALLGLFGVLVFTSSRRRASFRTPRAASCPGRRRDDPPRAV